MKQCFSTLLPTICKNVNLSLRTAVVPSQLKEPMIHRLLKNQTLPCEEFSTFRPISKLTFLCLFGKILYCCCFLNMCWSTHLRLESCLLAKWPHLYIAVLNRLSLVLRVYKNFLISSVIHKIDFMHNYSTSGKWKVFLKKLFYSLGPVAQSIVSTNMCTITWEIMVSTQHASSNSTLAYIVHVNI